MFHLQGDTRNVVLQTLGSTPPNKCLFFFSRRGGLHTLVTHHSPFCNAGIQKPEKLHGKLVMKLTGLLVALFINERRNTWPTAMTHTPLLHPDQVRMLLYYDWLISEPYGSHPDMHPLYSTNHFSLKVIALPFTSECVFQLAHTNPGGSTNLGKCAYAIGITAMAWDVPPDTCFTVF